MELNPFPTARPALDDAVLLDDAAPVLTPVVGRSPAGWIPCLAASVALALAVLAAVATWT